jgi:hypothetical protein
LKARYLYLSFVYQKLSWSKVVMDWKTSVSTYLVWRFLRYERLAYQHLFYESQSQFYKTHQQNLEGMHTNPSALLQSALENWFWHSKLRQFICKKILGIKTDFLFCGLKNFEHWQNVVATRKSPISYQTMTSIISIWNFLIDCKGGDRYLSYPAIESRS